MNFSYKTESVWNKKSSNKKLESSGGSIGKELKSIIDSKEIQSLMDNFYTLTNMGIAIIDLHGNILVSTGWQEVCTRFHRANKNSLKNCIESDLYLTQNIKPGEYSLYKCKNNMWDIATPIIVDGKHMGNLFFGQFFFEDEVLDYKMFTAQAEKFGFDKEKYLKALELVPRRSKEQINILINFYSRLAHLISTLGFKNLMLAKSLSIYRSTEKALKKSENLLSKIFDILPVGLWIADKSGKLIRSNRKGREIWGSESYTGKEQHNIFSTQRLLSSEEIASNNKTLAHAINSGGTVKDKMLEIETYDGKKKTILNYASPVLDEDGKIEASVIVNLDITEQKEAERQIKESELKYRTIFETAPVGIITLNKNGIIASCNNSVLKFAGLPENRIVGKHFKELGILKAEEIEKYTRIFKNIIKSKKTEPFYSTLSTSDKNEIISEVYPSIVLEDGKIAGIQVIIRDVTHEIKAEENIKKSYQRIQKTLEGTISCLSSILELKDPYTGGHQKNVAKLCTAMAQELGMDEERINALHTSALIHDIGKIVIPPSILSKPTTLSEIEISMIQTHSAVGYEILNKIDFGYPLADIILQHHERINGSGYPNGLKDKKILLEAKVLGVADTVEAMANHRPYRPAFGIDKALDEIEINKGILYDSSVVDACLKIFKKKGFKF